MARLVLPTNRAKHQRAQKPRTVYRTEFVPVLPGVEVGFPGLTAVGLPFAPPAVGLFGLIG
jgi:hypothetical protein